MPKPRAAEHHRRCSGDKPSRSRPDVYATRHCIDLSRLFELLRIVEDNFRRAVVQLDHIADANALPLKPRRLTKFRAVVAENDGGEGRARKQIEFAPRLCASRMKRNANSFSISPVNTIGWP
jgi:hypothetical protein